MSKLISGKEALIALANGDDVEWNCHGFSGESWHNILSSPHTKIGAVDMLKHEYGNVDVGYYTNVLFRIKPKTMTLNGVEIPAPFVPEEGEVYHYLDNKSYFGYSSKIYSEHDQSYLLQFGVWDTEDKIKQVVEVLIGIFNGKS